MGLKGFAILYIPSNSHRGCHFPLPCQTWNKGQFQGLLKVRTAALAVAALSACVIAKSISKN